MLELKVILGPEKEPIVRTFSQPSVTIGRASGNDLSLDVDGVSRYHGILSLEGQTLILKDLDSTNGTFVNEKKIQGNKSLSVGDSFTIGSAAVIVLSLGSEGSSTNGFEPEEDDESPTIKEKALKEEADSLPKSAAQVASEKAEKAEKALSQDFYWKSMESFLAPIWPYIMDESVTEIMINGPKEVYVERKGELDHVNIEFNNEKLKAAVLNIAQYVGRRASEDEPYLDARLPDGSRVAVLMPPCARKGISIAIRKFAKEKLTIEKLLSYGSLSKEMAIFLDACVRLKKNIIVSGGTSSGKTSLLNVVSSLVPANERIITIEDAAELQLTQEHVVPMETKPPDKKGKGQVTIRDLLRASLRMRPDRIVVGEIRSGEALDLLQAMNTGHSGSMATVHASSPPQALTRLETLSLFSGIEIPVRALREQVSTAIEIIVQASRLPDHSRKVVYISEVERLSEDGSYRVRDIFKFKRTGREESGKIIGEHQLLNAPSFVDEMDLGGLTEAYELFKNRK